MSLGNLGAVKNRMDGITGIALTDSNQGGQPLAKPTQGSAMWPDMARDVLARADLVNSQNAFVSPLTAGSASAEVSIDTNPVDIYGFVAVSNHTATLYVQISDNGTVVAAIPVASKVSQAVVFPDRVQCLTNLKLGVTTTATGSTRTNGTLVSVAFVYAR